MEQEPVVVRGSVRPFVAAGSSSLVLSVLALASLSADGLTPWGAAVAAFALVAWIVLLLDLPRRTEVDAAGLVRVCLLRRGHIRWEDVVAIERQRRRLSGPGTGGLVVRSRRGRSLLSTTAEAPRIHAQLVDVVATHAPAVRMLAEPPKVIIGDR